MTDLKELNKLFGKDWKNESEIDWVEIAMTMTPDLDFMKENAKYLRPGFVIRNPAIGDFPMDNKIYSNWIDYRNEEDIYDSEIISEKLNEIAKLISNDPDFGGEELYVYEEGSGGFCGADQFDFTEKYIYSNSSDDKVSLDLPWEKLKPIFLEMKNHAIKSMKYWDDRDEKLSELTDKLEEELKDKTTDELLEMIKKYEEINEYLESCDEYDLIEELANCMLDSEEDNEENNEDN